MRADSRAHQAVPPSELPLRAVHLAQLSGPAPGDRTSTNTPEPQSKDVRTIRTCDLGASPSPSSAPSGLRKLGFIPPTPTNGSDPACCPSLCSDNASGTAPPFSSQARVPPPPATLRPLLPARPHRARPQSCAYLGAPAATRTRHPSVSSRPACSRAEDAVPVPSRRYRNPVSARVWASQTIHRQKGIEGGADPASRAAACAPRGGAEPSRAERSRAEPGGPESRGTEPSGAEPSGAERTKGAGVAPGAGRRGPGRRGKRRGAVPLIVVSRFSDISDV